MLSCAPVFTVVRSANRNSTLPDDCWRSFSRKPTFTGLPSSVALFPEPHRSGSVVAIAEMVCVLFLNGGQCGLRVDGHTANLVHARRKPSGHGDFAFFNETIAALLISGYFMAKSVYAMGRSAFPDRRPILARTTFLCKPVSSRPCFSPTRAVTRTIGSVALFCAGITITLGAEHFESYSSARSSC